MIILDIFVQPILGIEQRIVLDTDRPPSPLERYELPIDAEQLSADNKRLKDVYGDVWVINHDWGFSKL